MAGKRKRFILDSSSSSEDEDLMRLSDSEVEDNREDEEISEKISEATLGDEEIEEEARVSEKHVKKPKAKVKKFKPDEWLGRSIDG